jgi:steroid 5-alpha reductase family enzyme
MLLALITAQVLTHAFFIWAQKIKNWGVIDIAWGLGFIVTTLTVFLQVDQVSISKLIVFMMTCIWSLRLSIYLFVRNHGKPEDWRYQQFRSEWAPNENVQAYLKVFVFQGLLMFLISLPQMLFIRDEKIINWGLMEVVGLIIWIQGFMFETLADWQLARFKKDVSNKGKVMTKGVWSLSRHPNYYGEVTLWWGFYIMLFNYVPWWTAIGPLLITFFIVNVTGIALLEKRYEGNQEFEKYKGRTSVFFPWLPKKD